MNAECDVSADEVRDRLAAYLGAREKVARMIADRAHRERVEAAIEAKGDRLWAAVGALEGPGAAAAAGLVCRHGGRYFVLLPRAEDGRRQQLEDGPLLAFGPDQVLDLG